MIICRESLEYENIIYASMFNLSTFLSLIIDGMDQSEYCLLHFAANIKSELRQAMNVRLIGSIQHSFLQQLRFLKISEDHLNVAKNIVETLHISLTDIRKYGPLSNSSYLQFKNCTRENKNHYLLAYVDFLAQWKEFDDTLMLFQPIGHTHVYMYQCFTIPSEGRKNYTITLTELNGELKRCDNDHKYIERLN